MIGSATPEASSTINSILSSWNPCIFSGVVAVLATAYQRSLLPIIDIFVLVHCSISFNNGDLLCHFETSAHRTSFNWCSVGAVATTLAFSKQLKNHNNVAASNPVFPTPCPDFIVTFELSLKANAASFCHSSG